MHRIKAFLVAMALLFASAAGRSAPFTVADSIEMWRFADPDVSWAQYRAPKFKISADGKQFFFVVRRGNLASGKNEYGLYLHHTSDVLAYVASSSTSEQPKPKRVATFETASIWPGIDQAVWLADSKRIAFIGRGEDQLGQVYLYDVDSGALERLTNHPENIMRFALSADAELLVYGAHVYPDWSSRNNHGYAVRAEHASSLAWSEPRESVPEVRYYIANLRSGSVMGPSRIASRYPEDIWMSPSGRRAIVVSYLEHMPPAWGQYEFVRQMQARAEAAGTVAPQSEGTHPIDNDLFGDWSVQARRLELIDTTDGTSRPLIDAPLTGAPFIGVEWSRDDQRVLIGPSYEPLPSKEQRGTSRTDAESILLVDVAQGGVEKIADVPQASVLTALDWDKGREVVATLATRGKGESTRVWKKARRGGWQAMQDKVVRQGDAPLTLAVQQDLNTPPELVARNSQTQAARVITDLNPQLRQMNLGAAEVFTWSDSDGRSYEGGLVFPPSYDRSKRYPLVVQTYGFDSKSFLLDGASGITSAYAARALAGAGMMVLQLPLRESNPGQTGDCSTWEQCGENPRFLLMLESALSQLESKELIDTSRVGLIGFSREGMHVHHALTFSGRRFAAASICDSVAATPFTYSLLYSFPFPGVLDMESPTMMGAPFWGQGIKLWLDRSPAFHLDNIRTPLRIDAIGKGINGHWDTFVQLKRHQRPVELYHIPLDTHNLHTPWGRYASMQGNVDWFRFWLLGEEDPADSKKAQYERWRVLRQQQQRLEKTPEASPAVSAVTIPRLNPTQ